MADVRRAGNLAAEWLAVRWVRQELPPEEVQALAIDAMTHGCDSPSLRLLAGLDGRPTMADVHELVETCLPYEGASAIAQLSSEWWDEPPWMHLRDFIGLASEWEDHPPQRAKLDREIVACAVRLVSHGGFRPQ